MEVAMEVKMEVEIKVDTKVEMQIEMKQSGGTCEGVTKRPRTWWLFHLCHFDLHFNLHFDLRIDLHFCTKDIETLIPQTASRTQ